MPDLSSKGIRRDRIQFRKKANEARKMLAELMKEKKEIAERIKMKREQAFIKKNASDRHTRARELEVADLVEEMIYEGKLTQNEWQDYVKGDMVELKSLIAGSRPLNGEAMQELVGWVKAHATLAPSSQAGDDRLARAILGDVMDRIATELEAPIRELILQKIQRGVHGGESCEAVTAAALERAHEIIDGDHTTTLPRPASLKRDREPVEVHVIESSQETEGRMSRVMGSIARSVTPKGYAGRFEHAAGSPDRIKEMPVENNMSLSRIRSHSTGGHPAASSRGSTRSGKDMYGYYRLPTPELFEGLRGDSGKRWAKEGREAIRNVMLGTAKSVLFREVWNAEEQDYEYWIRIEEADRARYSDFFKYIAEYKDGNEARKMAWMELLSPTGTQFRLVGSKTNDVEKLAMCAMVVMGEIPGAREADFTSKAVFTFAFEQASRLLGHMVTSVADLSRECRSFRSDRKQKSKNRAPWGGGRPSNTFNTKVSSSNKNGGRPSPSGGFTGRCDTCGVVGHKRANCPNRKSK